MLREISVLSYLYLTCFIVCVIPLMSIISLNSVIEIGFSIITLFVFLKGRGVIREGM